MIRLASTLRLTLLVATFDLGACATLTENTVPPTPLPGPAQAPASESEPSDELVGPRFGGTGGSGSQVRCPYSHGLQGQAGSLLDRVGMVCFTDDRSWDSPSYGGTGGQRFQHLCPPGARAIGIYGRSGDYIDRLGLRCSNSVGQPSTSEAPGGAGGAPFAWECPTGYALIGLDLMSGDYVDSVAAVCSRR